MVKLVTPTWSDSPESWTITSGPPFTGRECKSASMRYHQNTQYKVFHVPESPEPTATPGVFAHNMSFGLWIQATAWTIAVCISIAGTGLGALLVSPQPKTSKFWPLTGTSRLRFNLTGSIVVICCPTGRKIRATSFPALTTPLYPGWRTT